MADACRDLSLGNMKSETGYNSHCPTKKIIADFNGANRRSISLMFIVNSIEFLNLRLKNDSKIEL